LAVVLMVVAYVVPLLVGTGICIPHGDGCAPASAWADGCASAAPDYSHSHLIVASKMHSGIKEKQTAESMIKLFQENGNRKKYAVR